MKEHRVLVDVLQEILPRRHTVGIETDLPLTIVKVQHRVQRVVVLLIYAAVEHRCLPSFSSPVRTRAISVSVPASSNE